jgi:chemotaxis protein methyltransferase CheR
MDFEAFLRLVEEATGIKPEGARLKRLKKLYEEKGKGLVKSLEKASINGSLWQEVIEAVSVQETYFYRDGEVFECLRVHIIPELLKLLKEREVRVWSAGCATGEETYTLAMLFYETAKEKGIKEKMLEDRLLIIGTDISERALKIAEEGVYKVSPMGSLRKAPPFLMEYFEPHGKEIRVKDKVRRLVRFYLHNLLSGSPPLSPADLILCRNVLIYFSETAKQKAYDTFVSSLRKGGFLVLGALDEPNRGLEKRSCGKVIYFVKP